MTYLLLEDGTVFAGEPVAAGGHSFGEAVFTTSMSGYQETVTDPSYVGQIVCFSAPMIGNYGVAEHRTQSDRVHATGVVMREARGPEWTDWLRERGVVALTGVDTRSLVLHLRDREAVVLRRHEHAAGLPLEHRMVRATVAERELVRLMTGRAGDELVAEADTEHVRPAE